MSIKIYKNYSHKNRFVSLFLTDVTLTICTSVITLYLLFALLPVKITLGGLNPIVFKILIGGLFSLFYFFLFNGSDQGKKYTHWGVVKIKNLFTNKKQTQSELKYMNDYYYKIKDSFVHTQKSLQSTFILHPVDIAVMDEAKQKQFFAGMHRLLHGLGDDEIQINISNRRATIDDYASHFKVILDQAKINRVGLSDSQHNDILIQSREYTDNLKEKIEYDYVPFKDFILTIGVPLPKDSNSKSYEEAKKKLISKINNYIPRFESIGIKCELLLNESYDEKTKSNVLYNAIYKNIQESK